MTDVVHQSHSEIETPVSAESAIDFCISQIRRAPDILRERLERFQDLKHLYDIKAEAAYKYAQARTRAYEKELSGRQSVNKSVSNSYNTSGWRS